MSSDPALQGRIGNKTSAQSQVVDGKPSPSLLSSFSGSLNSAIPLNISQREMWTGILFAVAGWYFFPNFFGWSAQLPFGRYNTVASATLFGLAMAYGSRYTEVDDKIVNLIYKDGSGSV